MEGRHGYFSKGIRTEKHCNGDKTGVFNKLIPKRTLTLKAEPCHGRENLKKD